LPRALSSALLVALLAASAVAFAVTEGLKLEPSPVRSVYVDKLFSPTCECDTNQAYIRFQLRKRDHLTLAIVNGDGTVVRTLIGPRNVAKGRIDAYWNGRDEAGAVVPDGLYRPRLHLDRAHKTIVLPSPIRVDSTPPRITLVRLGPSFFSPDGDGRNDEVTAVFRANEPVRPEVFVNGHRRVAGKFARTHDRVRWYGIVDGRPLPAGAYRITLAGRDLAGNLSDATDSRFVKIRYVGFTRNVVRTVAGTRFRVRIVSDAALVRWRFAGGTGRARPGPLVLRAPAKPGRYRLFVEERGHGASLPVVVRPKA
jgi:hypothetical protein